MNQQRHCVVWRVDTPDRESARQRGATRLPQCMAERFLTLNCSITSISCCCLGRRTPRPQNDQRPVRAPGIRALRSRALTGRASRGGGGVLEASGWRRRARPLLWGALLLVALGLVAGLSVVVVGARELSSCHHKAGGAPLQ